MKLDRMFFSKNAGNHAPVYYFEDCEVPSLGRPFTLVNSWVDHFGHTHVREWRYDLHGLGGDVYTVVNANTIEKGREHDAG